MSNPGGPLDEVLAADSPVVLLLAILTLVVAFIILFVKANTAIGDRLDWLSLFDISISKRPKSGQPYKPPPQSGIFTALALLVAGFGALCLVTVVAWMLIRLSDIRPVL